MLWGYGASPATKSLLRMRETWRSALEKPQQVWVDQWLLKSQPREVTRQTQYPLCASAFLSTASGSIENLPQ